MKKKQTLEYLLNDPKMNERLKERLYSKKGLLGKEYPYSEILQQMVNTLEGKSRVFSMNSALLGVSISEMGGHPNVF